MAEIPTVKIKSDTELGYIIINKEDFDPEFDELYREGPETTDLIPDANTDEPQTDAVPEKPLRSEPRRRKTGLSEDSGLK